METCLPADLQIFFFFVACFKQLNRNNLIIFVNVKYNLSSGFGKTFINVCSNKMVKLYIKKWVSGYHSATLGI